jgi:hypothetical protein
MKKFFGILAIAGLLASCDNAANSDATADSLRRDSIRLDSINKAASTTPPVVDTNTTITVDTTQTVTVDTTKKP